jgi:hypothetical protein
VAAGYHPGWGGRYDSREDRSPTPEPLGTRVFRREICTASFSQCFRQPTSIDKYTGDMDPRVWLNDYCLICQLGGATIDEVIRNLPLHLADSARTWLEHLPPSQIHNWDNTLKSTPSNQEEPSGAPSDPTGAEPMDEDPSNEAFVLFLLEGYGADEARAMDTESVPHAGDWRDKYIASMDRGELPPDRSEARHIARMAKSFALIDGELYKCATSSVLQRCVPIPQGHELLRDIHAGMCCHHAAPCTLVGNAYRQGFYWPTAVADASEIVRTCEGCPFQPTRPTSLCTPSKQSRSHGPSPCGGWTSSGPCGKRPGATPTCWLPLTNSPSGSRCTRS